MMCLPCEPAKPASAPELKKRKLMCADGCYLAGGGEPGKMSWSAAVHMVVHPGCDGNHGSSLSSDSVAADNPKEDNLNVTSAMLHLVADVLRGIAILVTAILIQ